MSSSRPEEQIIVIQENYECVCVCMHTCKDRLGN